MTRLRSSAGLSEAPWVPTSKDLWAARTKTVPDVIRPRLKVLFVGINPGLYSAAVGHHFARPGNRFWPALRLGGITKENLSPFEDRQLLDLGYGITNVVDRASAAADELSKAELQGGGQRLLEKVRLYRPRVVAFLGIQAYRTAFCRKEAKVGLQRERLGDSLIWLLPNPSGLNAHYRLSDLGKLFADLKRHAEGVRSVRETPLSETKQPSTKER